MQGFQLRDKSISIYVFLYASSRVRSGSASHHRSSADTSSEARWGASSLSPPSLAAGSCLRPASTRAPSMLSDSHSREMSLFDQL